MRVARRRTTPTTPTTTKKTKNSKIMFFLVSQKKWITFFVPPRVNPDRRTGRPARRRCEERALGVSTVHHWCSYSATAAVGEFLNGKSFFGCPPSVVQRRISITRHFPEDRQSRTFRGCGPIRNLRTVRSGITSQRTRFASGVERQNAIQKRFRFWYFLAQWEFILDRILAFDSNCESCASDRVPTANCSQVPYRSAPSKVTRLTVSPPRQQQQRAAARATAAFLNRFGCKPTGGRCVFECKCVRIWVG